MLYVEALSIKLLSNRTSLLRFLTQYFFVSSTEISQHQEHLLYPVMVEKEFDNLSVIILLEF